MLTADSALRMLQQMRKSLLIFACGFVAGIITVWGLGRVRDLFGLQMSDAPVETAQGHPPLPSPPERPPRSDSPASVPVPTDQGPPELPLQANSSNITDMAQTLLIQHLHPRLQTALKQYATLDDKDDRSGLADDVANLVNDDVPVRDAVEALGVMFHQERSIEVKINILNNLLNLDDPSSYQLIVQGADPNQPQEVRKAAVAVLGDYDDTWAVPTLQQLLSDGDAEIRQAAQEALAQKTEPTPTASPFPMVR
jgi:HEAT repeats